ncbi:hypothetical protein [Roseicella sp. DB1501]|nr:hypothetical protein [Roseicella sp. DB1501]NOG69469.1 hypothetical protein [Roseicella sp. DB1501]
MRRDDTKENMVTQAPEHHRLMLPRLLVALAVGAWLLVLGSIILTP